MRSKSLPAVGDRPTSNASSSDSGIRPRVSLEDLERRPKERATVVFRRMLPIEGLVHFIRRHALRRLGKQDLNVRVEAREQGSFEVVVRVDEHEVAGRASDPFVATLRAFDSLT